MKTKHKKNQLFVKYGHKCDMENELDELPQFIPGNTLYAQLKRVLMRFRMISETNKRCNHHIRSQGAISLEKHRHLKKHTFMLHPFSDARKWWEFFMCIVFFNQFIAVPLEVALFRLSYINMFSSIAWKSYRTTMDVFFLLDICVNFITGDFNMQRKQAELSPKIVSLKYLKTTFFMDVISSIPTHFELFVEIEDTVFLYLQLFSLFKLYRFRTFMIYCKRIGEVLEISYVWYKILMVCVITFLFYHIVTCEVILWRISEKGYLFKLYRNLRRDDDLSYSRAFYGTLILTRMAGYKSQKSMQHLEIIITLCIWIISKLLIIFTVGKIIQILKATTSSRQKYIEMVRQLRDYMCHRQLPEHMQRRLLTYYEFRFQNSYFRESEILSTISGQLRQEIVMYSCRKLVENVAFFKNLPFTLLVRIVSCLRSEIYLVNDVIVKAATVGNSMFFIASGTVAVYTSSGREICHLEDGAHFGEIALIMKNQLRIASVVAIDVCELYRLDRKEFVRAIHPYPDLLDNIQRIAADRMEQTTILDELDKQEMATKQLT
ncbi:hypothetical protein FQA39_LY10345 [Lamprigera yunnana]|nr:hypothetical protein FQA39_LY10345 [Lamprigera yunnana]